MWSQEGGPRDVHVGVAGLQMEEGRVERREAPIHPPLRARVGPFMTVGIRRTSSTGASRNRRGRASVRGIGISTYLLMRGAAGFSMSQCCAPPGSKSSDRRYEI